MGGLESIEVTKKSVYDNNRLDNDYYQKRFVQVANIVRSGRPLRAMASAILCGPFGSNLRNETYQKTGVAVIRPFNIKNCTVESENHVYISAEDVARKKFPIHAPNTIFFARVGEVGCGVNPFDNVVISPNIIAATFPSPVVARFLAVFFNCKYGSPQIERNLKVVAQPTITTSVVGKLMVPDFSDNFIKTVSSFLLKSMVKEATSKHIMKEANNTFLSNLGLDSWQPNNSSTSVTQLSELSVTNRWDAAYYMPKYAGILATLRRAPHQKLDELVHIRKSIEPGSEAYQESGIPFIRVSNLSSFGISAVDKHLDESEYGEIADELSPRKNTILFSKDGTLGIAYKMEQDMRAITSGAILHLTQKRDIDLDYLTLALNAMPTQMQAERDSGGAIIQHWRPDQIREIVIPILPSTKRKQLAAEARKSFQLRRQSEVLLQTAKSAVETAIEKGEKAAMKMLEKES